VLFIKELNMYVGLMSVVWEHMLPDICICLWNQKQARKAWSENNFRQEIEILDNREKHQNWYLRPCNKCFSSESLVAYSENAAGKLLVVHGHYLQDRPNRFYRTKDLSAVLLDRKIRSPMRTWDNHACVRVWESVGMKLKFIDFTEGRSILSPRSTVK
jgi:hypothetical protein